MQDQNRNDFLSTKNELKDAINRGDTEAAYRLMSQGDHINYILDDCIANDDVEAVKLVLQYDFDLNKLHNNDATALNLAISRGNEEIISLLINEGADAYTSLERSLRFSQINELEKLLHYNANVNLDEVVPKIISVAVMESKQTPRHIPFGIKIIYTLLDRGVDVKEEDLGGVSKLIEARNACLNGIKLEDFERYNQMPSKKSFTEIEERRRSVDPGTLSR